MYVEVLPQDKECKTGLQGCVATDINQAAETELSLSDRRTYMQRKHLYKNWNQNQRIKTDLHRVLGL